MLKQIHVKNLLLLLILALTMAACGGNGEEADEDAGDNGNTVGDDAAASSGTDGTEKPTIKLVVNAWSASELNVAVAQIILEEEMGYPVEVISLDENAQWAAIGSGDAHASLEVWPSGHAQDVADYIEGQGVIVNGGRLGPVGQIGWYVPTYMLEQDPDLATWEGFVKPETGTLFATAETGELGQFLGGDPSFVEYDGDIITNLGIPFEVIYAGSEEAILAQLDAAVSREDPVLFYLWTPHAIHAKYDLTRVELPAYSDACYEGAETGGVDCDYPADELFKIFWSGLEEYAPEAFQMLSNMNYTTEDQIAMMAGVELDGLSVEESARQWLDDNEATWQGWKP